MDVEGKWDARNRDQGSGIRGQGSGVRDQGPGSAFKAPGPDAGSFLLNAVFAG
jgi:hypothetical protein